MSTASELYHSGDLQQAISVATEVVRQSPTDADARGLLFELLCFMGEFERADRQLDTLSHQDPSIAVGISLLRQLLRAEQARQEFYANGRVPEFLDRPPEWVQLHLRASICLRDNQSAEAMQLLEQAQSLTPELAGTCNDEPFRGLRDTDELTSCVFEVLTSTGKYFWIPMDRVESIEFREPKRPHDLIWRAARMIVRDGPDGEVYLPAIYAGIKRDDNRLRLGRLTEWEGGEGTPVRGLGQRVFEIGGEDRAIMDIETLNFTSAESTSTPKE